MSLHFPFEGLHVLVVEDDAIQAFEIVSSLDKLKAVTVGPVPSIEQALKEIAEAPQIDVALIDVILRHKISFPIADELIRQGIPFAFITGSPEKVASYSAVPVHAKPADIVTVLKGLQPLIR